MTEAMRGEGGQLFNAAGHRFMPDYSAQAELAPRDVVAAAIHKEMKSAGTEFVHLSMKHLDGAFLRKRFPNVHEACLAHGIDITTDLIPVAPAAHYWIGGIVTGRMAGSSLWGLFACGECACTGVHGANRLASNSLLECLVFAKRAVDGALTVAPARLHKRALHKELPVRDRAPVDPELLRTLRLRVSRVMTEQVGILRTGAELQKAHDELQGLIDGHRDLLAKWAGRPLRNMLRVCLLTVRGALWREESRGAHRREDFPGEDPRFDGHITHRRGATPRIVKWT